METSRFGTAAMSHTLDIHPASRLRPSYKDRSRRAERRLGLALIVVVAGFAGALNAAMGDLVGTATPPSALMDRPSAAHLFDVR